MLLVLINRVLFSCRNEVLNRSSDFRNIIVLHLGLPGGISDREPKRRQKRQGFRSKLGRSLEVGMATHSSLENSNEVEEPVSYCGGVSAEREAVELSQHS